LLFRRLSFAPGAIREIPLLGDDLSLELIGYLGTLSIRTQRLNLAP
jgi:hypothetical protein